MHAWWSPDDSVSFLEAELARAFPGCSLKRLAPGFLGIEDAPDAGRIPMAFAGQALPAAEMVAVTSIRVMAEALAHRILEQFSDDGPWRMHLTPCFGQGTAGEHRCSLIDEAVVEILGRHHARGDDRGFA